MHPEIVSRLRCPRSGQALRIEDAEHRDGKIYSGWLVAVESGQRYPVREYIPRFVPQSNYADSFGMQWSMFSRTQLDSFSGHDISARRFWTSTQWTPADVGGQWVLDVGCGAGRFAEVALEAGATVVAVDFSSAADVCYANLQHHRNLHVVQADIYSLPFPRGTFPFVYSLGVLQHTPDVASAFAALPPMVAPGGSLCADFYEMTWRHRLLPRHYLRPFTRSMSKDELFQHCRVWVPRLLRVSRAVARMPLMGESLKRLVPVADYSSLYDLADDQLEEWALLDTFDWLSPAYDQPQKRRDVAQWIAAAGFRQVAVVKAGFMVARGKGKL